MTRAIIAALWLANLAACHPAVPPGDRSRTAGTEDARPYDGIAPGETVRFTGTEPFWGGEVTGSTLRYATPDVPNGLIIPVERFAGRGGVSWSGAYQGGRFSLAVTPVECADGMSDRRYPFTATLTVGGEQRNGCAWTGRVGDSGTEKP